VRKRESGQRSPPATRAEAAQVRTSDKARQN
jgi:hypothetical protein